MLQSMRLGVVFAGLLCLAGCVKPPPPKDYTTFRAADPKSMVVVPVINHSVYVNAPDYFLSTITRPLAERGYYVFPVHMVKRLLEDDGLSDADLVHNAKTAKLASLFGADSVLYITIERWDSQYVVLATTTTVEINYVLKDSKTAERVNNNETAGLRD